MLTVSLFFGVCIAVMLTLTLSTMRRAGTALLPASWWLAVALVAMWPWAYARPQAIAFMLMAAQLWMLERWVARRDRTIFLLPLLYLPWANLHGSFAVGLAMPALLLAAETTAPRLGWGAATRLQPREVRRLAVALAVSVAVLSLNPNGPRLLLYPFTKLHNPLLTYLGEWNGTDVSNPVLWPFVLLAASWILLVMLRRPNLPASDLLLGCAFVAGAMWSMRFIPFASIVLAVLIGRILTLPNGSGLRAPALARRLDRWRQARARVYTQQTGGQQVMNAMVIALGIIFALATRHPYDPAHDAKLPVAAVDTLGAEGLREPLYNAYQFGGYLIWRLWPERQVFIDGRGDDLYMKGDELRRYFQVDQLDDGAEGVLDQYHIATVLYPKDTVLVRYLLGTGRWQSTYDDGHVVRLERAAGTAPSP
jgi:hypothetical protein